MLWKCRILGLMIPKKNAAVCNGITIVLCEMEGCNMVPKFKGFLPRFPRWAVYEMMLVFPFHTGHGFFHSIQVQSRGIFFADCTTASPCSWLMSRSCCFLKLHNFHVCCSNPACRAINLHCCLYTVTIIHIFFWPNPCFHTASLHFLCVFVG